LRFHLFGNYSCVWCQWWNFRMPSTAPITAPCFDETSGICAICSSGWYVYLAGTRNHCEGSVVYLIPLFIDFGDRRKNFLANFKYFYGNKMHFAAFGVVYLHNVIFRNFFLKTYLTSPTSSPMRFWHFKCVKYANMPSIWSPGVHQGHEGWDTEIAKYIEDCRSLLTWPFFGKLLRSTFWYYH
jgi:hypothetical protein